jgi:hypothetical protein
MSAFLRRLGELAFFRSLHLAPLDSQSPLKPSQQHSGKAAIRFRRLPLAFEPNIGQAAAGADYLVRTGFKVNRTLDLAPVPSGNRVFF